MYFVSILVQNPEHGIHATCAGNALELLVVSAEVDRLE